MRPKSDASRARIARAAALAGVLVWTWASPTPARAQLPGAGSLIVTITAPASGATVGGTIPINASVSIVGLLTVQRVQFQLDGADFGAADTSAPYSVNWDSFPASNGTDRKSTRLNSSHT